MVTSLHLFGSERDNSEDFVGESDNFMRTSHPYAIRAIYHIPGSSSVIASGIDTKIRNWNLQHLDKSYIISGSEYNDRFSYRYANLSTFWLTFATIILFTYNGI